MRYKFSSSSFDQRRIKEFVCIYFFGKKTWDMRKARMLDSNGYASNETWDEFLNEQYKQILPHVTITTKPVAFTEEDENIFIYSVTKKDEEEPEDNRPTFVYWGKNDVKVLCEYILSCTDKGQKYTIKDLVNELHKNGMEEFVGICSADEGGKSYVYIFNREYDDVNIRIPAFEIRPQDIVNGLSLVLTGDYIVPENYSRAV